ncbi:MAG: dienelactone hydrolase family protein [Candidatus Rokubacteria bacterium]|nr:dienelactone hydrolase family protein [Candidatus Rokubacteria bacterium]
MRRPLAILALLAVAAGCAASTTGAARPGMASVDASLQATLRPHDVLLTPDGPGPFPAVIVLHGCLGVRSKDRRWAEHLRETGYVALLVDSMTGRGLTTRDDLTGVCRGLSLWGGTRAADVRASLAHLRTLPTVDPSRIAVLAFSHGAWAALDFLAGSDPEDVPGLRAVVAFYPYCGVASRARWLGWHVDVPTMLLLAGQDHVVSPAQCQGVAERAAADGRPVSVTVYPEARHAFDWRSSDATDDARRRVDAFLARHLAPGGGRQAGAGR